MGDTLGNVNLSIGLDKNKLEIGLLEVEAQILKTQREINLGAAKGGSVAIDAIKQKMDELRSKFKDLPLLQGSEEGLKEVRDVAAGLVQDFVKLQEVEQRAGLTLDQYVRKLKATGGLSTVGGAMGMPEKTIAQRAAKIKELNMVIRNLDSTTEGYGGTISKLNRKVQTLSETNKRAMNIGVEMRKQTLKLGDAAAWASRKLVFYTSIYTLQRFAQNVAKITGEFELQRKALAAIIQDKTAADRLFDQTVRQALQSPFQLKELVSYTKQLSAYRVETSKLFDTTKMLADVSAGLGVDMSRLVLAYGQVRAASVLRGQELRQFTEAGIPIINELAESFTKLYGRVVRTDEVFDLISKRLVPFQMVDDIFKKMTSDGGAFFNMQAIQAETLAGKISNLRDAYDIFFNKIGEEHMGTMKGFIDGIRWLMENSEMLETTIKTLIGLLAVYKINMIGSRLATGKLAETVLVGTGVFKGFANKGVGEAITALRAAKIEAGFVQKSLISLKLGAINLTYALKGLKTAFATLWPLLLVTALVEAYSAWDAYRTKVKEAREELDKNTVDVIKSNDAIDKQIQRLRELAKSDSKSNEVRKERVEILAKVGKAESELAKRLEENIDNEKELARIQEERNSMTRLRILINDKLKEEAGTDDDIRKQIDDLESLKAKYMAVEGAAENYFVLVQKKARDILKEGQYGGVALTSYLTDALTRLSNLSGTTLNKANYAFSAERMISSVYGAGSLGSALFGDDITKAMSDVFEYTAKIQKRTDKLNLSMKDMAKTVQEGIVGGFGGMGNVAEEQIGQIDNILSEQFNKTYAMQIMAQISFPNLVELPKPKAVGWKKELLDMGGNIVRELLAAEGATLLGTLDDIKKAYGEAKTAVDSYNKMSAKDRDMVKTDIDMAKNKVEVLGAILNRYNMLSESQDNRVDAIRGEIESYKSASEAYKDYLRVMDEASAMDKVKGLFPNLSVSGIKDPTAMMRDMVTKLNKIGTVAAKNYADTLNKLISEYIVKEDLGTLKTKIESIKKVVERESAQYKLGVEFEGVTGLNIESIFPDTTTFSSLKQTYLTSIKELREAGGEDNLKYAEELQSNLADLEIQRTKEVISKVTALREELATKEQKMAEEMNKELMLTASIAYYKSMGEAISNADALNLKYYELMLAQTRKVIEGMRNEILKSTDLYQTLFDFEEDVPLSKLRKVVGIFREALEGATFDESTKKYSVSFTNLDGSISKATLSLEEYLSLLKQTKAQQEKVDSKNPFASIGRTFGEMKKVFSDSKADPEKKMKAVSKFTTELSKGISFVGDAINEAGNIAEQLGASEADIALIKGLGQAVEGLGSMGQGVAKIMQGDIIGGVKETISGAIKAITGFIAAGDSRQQKIIDREKGRVEALQEAYEDLEKAKEKVFDLSGMAMNVKSLERNIDSQIQSLRRMRAAEDKKKKTDKDALKDYDNQIKELSERRIKLREEFLDTLRGTDIMSASEDFASAWVDAFLEGENAMDSFKDRFGEMIKQMIVKQAALRVASRILEPFFKSIDAAFGEEGILSAQEISALTATFSSLMGQIDTGMKQLIEPLLEAAGFTRGGGSLGSDSGLQRGIQGIQEETAGQIVAYLNSLRYEIFSNRELYQSMDINLSAINSITSDMLIEVSQMNSILREMREWQRSITSNGHGKGGAGLKVFAE